MQIFHDVEGPEWDCKVQRRKMRSRDTEARDIDNTSKLQGQHMVAGSRGSQGLRQELSHFGTHHSLCVHSSFFWETRTLFLSPESLLSQSEPFSGVSQVRTKGTEAFPPSVDTWVCESKRDQRSLWRSLVEKAHVGEFR